MVKGAGSREPGTGNREPGTGDREPGSASLERAYAACIRLARDHYENFPVASRLLPPALRKHVAAIYAFARTADDFADEPGRDEHERLQLLDDWLQCLRCCAMTPGSGLPVPGSRLPDPGLIFAALSHTIREFDLPLSLFEDLISAFRQDVTTTRYATWAEVLDYCRRSANPVGRLVLRLSGYRDDGLDRRSDAVCTALQLTNFWQDLVIDWRRGRLYVPEEIWRPSGARLADLDAGRFTPAWQAALEACGHRTRLLFDEGRPVADGVKGRLRLELRATWLGGMRILEKLERHHFDAFSHRPTLGGADAVVIGCKTLMWRQSA